MILRPTDILPTPVPFVSPVANRDVTGELARRLDLCAGTYRRRVIVLRNATLADQPLLASWDTQPDVQAASGNDDRSDWFEELECDAAWQENLIAQLDGRPIGVIQIIDPALPALRGR